MDPGGSTEKETAAVATFPLENDDKSSSQESFGSDTKKPSSMSLWHTVLIIFSLTTITVSNSLSLGLVTIGLPRIAEDLALSGNLLLWPATVNSLAAGCCQLLAGSVADIVGSRRVSLCGTFILGVFTLACGLAQTGIQLIIFRVLQGVGVSMVFPTSVSILTASFPHGKARTFGFSCLGFGIPLGFAVGLIFGGIFESTSVGWRLGFYLCAGAMILLFFVNCFFLPPDRLVKPVTLTRLQKEVDWVGVAISTTSLALLSYVFSVMTGSLASVRSALNATLLSISLVLIPAFIWWMHFQEKRGKPALIPNSLWKNARFSFICIIVFLSWAVLNSMEWFFSLFFQQVQNLSALQSGPRFLPNLVVGIIANVLTGLLVHRMSVVYLVVLSSSLAAISPLLMAIINPAWTFWYCAFWAMLLLPASVDVIYTVANLIVTDVFPENTQALAGAVFNTIAQFGTSVGIAVMAVIASAVTQKSAIQNKNSPDALMEGYRATFWACFAFSVMVVLLSGWGLRGTSKVGVARS
ncbi:aminotriazole resistance protein [Viridothelium virens]|uniref:Aminotriazole resistance protein n=1 Tax=Viridothelium virens TaxID=1048519 RepID=A0A6A6HF76_VIRVR|nr:aminotriazole resistance protein [Viridothelium virens]